MTSDNLFENNFLHVLWSFHLSEDENSLLYFLGEKITSDKELAICKIDDCVSVLRLPACKESEQKVFFVLKSISEKAVWLTQKPCTAITSDFSYLCHLINGVTYLSGEILVSFDENIRWFLKKLTERFTKDQFHYVSTFCKSSTAPLYEMFLPLSKGTGEVNMNAETSVLLNYLGLSNALSYYEKPSLFDIKVISECISEINNKTELSISYERKTEPNTEVLPVKKSTVFSFWIKRKESVK